MAKAKTKTEWDDFLDMYALYANMNQALEDANKEDLQRNKTPVKNLTKIAVQMIDEGLKLPRGRRFTEKPEILAGIENGSDFGFYADIFKQALPFEKDHVNKYAMANLEAVLANADEGYTNWLVLAKISPKSKFQGNNAAVYDRIAKKHQRFKSLAEIGAGGDGEAVLKEVQNQYKREYNSKNKNENAAMKLCQALASLSEPMRMLKYQGMIEKAKEEFETDLTPNKAGYLAAHIKDEKDFVDYFGQSMAEYENFKKQAEYEARRAGSQQRQGPGRRSRKR
jgi:hypothetical protein